MILPACKSPFLELIEDDDDGGVGPVTESRLSDDFDGFRGSRFSICLIMLAGRQLSRRTEYGALENVSEDKSFMNKGLFGWQTLLVASQALLYHRALDNKGNLR